MADVHKSENCNETVSTDELGLPHKKRKVDVVDEEPGQDKHHHMESFEGFQLVKVLGKDPQTKTIFVHGKS